MDFDITALPGWAQAAGLAVASAASGAVGLLSKDKLSAVIKFGKHAPEEEPPTVAPAPVDAPPGGASTLSSELTELKERLRASEERETARQAAERHEAKVSAIAAAVHAKLQPELAQLFDQGAQLEARMVRVEAGEQRDQTVSALRDLIQNLKGL